MQQISTMFFSTNIKLLRNRKGISQEEVANILGIKRTSLTGYEKGNSAPALKGLIGFSDYYKVSLDLLLKVDLQTYSESKLSQLDRRELDIQGSHLRVLATTIGDDNEENIELVPKKAKAGYTEGHRDPDFINVLSTFRMPFLDRSKKYRTFQISGDSMPPVAEGSWVTGEFIQNWKYIRDGYPYIVVTKDDGIVFKIAYNRLEKGKLLLCSTNTFYEPYEVIVENVLEVWSFTHFISSEMPVNRYKN